MIYLFTLKIKKLHQPERTITGIREVNNQWIEDVWRHYEYKVRQKFSGELVSFEVVQISRNSQEYKKWRAEKGYGPHRA